MKRGSIIGPVLLILLGALFLANNVMPELPTLKVVAEYWPFLLIVWGALRLIEILYTWGRGRSLPKAGVGGGEWALVIFIALIGSGLFAAHRYSANWPRARITTRGIEVFGETHEFPLAATHKAGKAPRIIIENLRGNTRVTPADVEEVKVTGRSMIRAFQQPDADKANKECPLEIVPQGDKLLIRTNQDRAGGALRISADLEITVPRGASIEGRGRYGDFEISDIAGDVDINSDNAGVRLQNIGGAVRLDLRKSDIVRAVNVKGVVDLKGRGEDVELENIAGEVTLKFPYTGEMVFRNLAKPLKVESSLTELRVEKLPGHIRMALGEFNAANLVGPVRLHTKSNDVHISDFTETMDIEVERGDIELRPGRLPLAKMDVRTGSGNVELALPAAAKFDLTARTKRGEVRNDFGGTLQVEEESDKGRGAVLRGAVGSGPAITVNTERGGITITKSSAETTRASEPPVQPPAPPAAPKPPKEPVTLQKERQ